MDMGTWQHRDKGHKDTEKWGQDDTGTWGHAPMDARTDGGTGGITMGDPVSFLINREKMSGHGNGSSHMAASSLLGVIPSSGWGAAPQLCLQHSWME